MMRKCATRDTPGALAAIHRAVSAAFLVALASGCTRARAAESSATEGSSARPNAMLQQQSGPAPNHAWVIFGNDTVVAEVARTPQERERGLMNRQRVPSGTGMLFVFDDMAARSFWMQNTYVALDIAFLDASYRVVNIDHMAPMTTDSHDSAGPAMFALEVPQGWFAAHGVKRDDHASVVYGVQLKSGGG